MCSVFEFSNFLYILQKNGDIDVVDIKYVDDLLATGTDRALKSYVAKFGQKFKLGDIANGPGRIRFYGLDIIQLDDFSSMIDGDYKLRKIEPYPLSRMGRKMCDEEMNAIEPLCVCTSCRTCLRNSKLLVFQR